MKRARPPPLQRVDVPHSTEQVDQSPVDAIAVTPDLEPEAAGGRTRGTSALLRLFAESAAAKVPAVIGLLDQFLDSAVSGKVTDSGWPTVHSVCSAIRKFLQQQSWNDMNDIVCSIAGGIQGIQNKFVLFVYGLKSSS